MSGSDPRDGTGRIQLTAASPGVAFTVVDGTFQVVARAVGTLDAELPHGIYEISIRAGGSVETRLVSLQPGETWNRIGITPGMYAAAPLAGSRTAVATHVAAVEKASRAVATATSPAAAGLVLVVRRTDRGGTVLHHQQVVLLSQSLGPVARWPDLWDFDEDAGVATIGARLDPGPYVLRLVQARGPSLDQTVWLSAGWQTLVFCPNGTERADLDDAVVHMTRMNQPFPGEHAEVATAVEIATSGLRQGLPLVNEDLLRVLRDSNFANPMLGIAGAHAMLLRDQPEPDKVSQVVAELRKLLPDHPDVLALARHPSLASAFASVELPSVWWPPMLAASYDKALLPADQHDVTAILDGSPAERVAGYVVQRGPWLCWEATPAVLSPAVEPTEPSIEPSAEPSTVVSSATTEGAKRRLQRHVREVASLTGDNQHKVAGALGVQELARRLQLPVQTVRTVMTELGWDTGLMDVPRTAADDEPSQPYEPFQPSQPSGPSRPPRPVRPGPRARPWMFVAAGVVVAVLLVVAGARYFGDRGGGGGSGEVTLSLANQPDFFDRTALRTQDLTVMIQGNGDPQPVNARIDGSGYVADASRCASVPAGTTCSVRITFGPPANQTQPMLATLVLTTKDATELRMPLYGTSRAPEGDISLEWDEVGEARIGETIRPTVVLDNIPPDAVHTVLTIAVPPGFDIGRFDAKDKCDRRRRTVIYCWVGLDSHHDDWRTRIPLIARSGTGGTLKVDAQLSRNPDLLDNNPEDNTAETTLTITRN
jgi:hypothetical protein